MRKISDKQGLFFVLLGGLKMCDRYKLRIHKSKLLDIMKLMFQKQKKIHSNPLNWMPIPNRYFVYINGYEIIIIGNTELIKYSYTK